MIYFTADTHFFHHAIIKYCLRPYADVHEMNKALIDNWNSRVTNNDQIFMLGDFGLCGWTKLALIYDQLNGQKIAIQGNHDSSRKLYKIGFPIVMKEAIIKYRGRRLWICHEPPPFPLECDLVIHGHLHNRDIDMGRDYICVSTELTGYTPISIHEIFVERPHILEE